MEQEKLNFSRKELEFAVFCIENIAEKLGKSGDEVYKMLTEKSDKGDWDVEISLCKHGSEAAFLCFGVIKFGCSAS